MNNPLVVIWMITYNHEGSIEQAVRSVMDQQANFPFLLVIGEDCSHDNTRELCKALKEEFPDKIDLILPEKNLGVYGPNAIGGKVFQKCFDRKPSYIALCEGDDYWSDLDKLQKQVDFLEKNTDYTNVITEGYIEEDGVLTRNYSYSGGELSCNVGIEELLSENKALTASVMFRNLPIIRAVMSDPRWSFVSWGDYRMHLACIKYGKMYCLKDACVVYRKTLEGIWSKKTYPVKICQGLAFWSVASQVLKDDNFSQIKRNLIRHKRLFLYHLIRFPSIQRLKYLKYIFS